METVRIEPFYRCVKFEKNLSTKFGAIARRIGTKNSGRIEHVFSGGRRIARFSALLKKHVTVSLAVMS